VSAIQLLMRWLLPALLLAGCGTQPLFSPESISLRDVYLDCVRQNARRLAISNEPADVVVTAAQGTCPREEQAAVHAMTQSAAIPLAEFEVRDKIRRDSYRGLLADVIEMRQHKN
jgi:hypothetical protein